MSDDDTRPPRGDRPPMPWVAFVFSMLVPLGHGLVSGGELRADVHALELRVDREVHQIEERAQRLEEESRSDRASTDKVLGELRLTIQQVQIDTARICARVRCGDTR